MRCKIWTNGIVVMAIASLCVANPVGIPDEMQIGAEVVQYITGPNDHPLLMPTDLEVDSSDSIYVADGVNNRIVVFTPDGRIDKIIGPNLSSPLDQPTGLTIDSQNRLWVADTGNHRIVVFSSKGQILETIDLPTTNKKEKADPTDIVISADGQRSYVVDNDYHRLLIRNNINENWKILGQRGRALGQFEYPFMICQDRNGYVYISEVMGSRVQVVSPTDRWAGLIGSWGVQLGQLYRAKGIAVDRQNRIYISDSVLQVIQVFDSLGNVQGVLCDLQGEILRFEHPMGLCFDHQGRLCIIELKMNRIAVVSLQPQELSIDGNRASESDLQ